MGMSAYGRARFYAKRWRWHNRNSLPWNRLRLHYEFMRRGAFFRWPIDGNVLQALRRGWLTMGEGVHLERDVWISVLEGRLTIGDHTAINHRVFISVAGEVDIGKHCLIGNQVLITDAYHRYLDPERPVAWQGMGFKAPVKIGDDCWIGVNTAILPGVTIGERCIIGSNSVVTKDLPARTVCAGNPAKPLRDIDYSAGYPTAAS